MAAVVVSPNAGFAVSRISVRTRHAREFVDLTDRVDAYVMASGVREGLAIVSSQHTTASIIVNEREPELMKDLDDLLARLAPEGDAYAHNAVPCAPGEAPNGHSHCQGLVLQASASIPIAGGEMALGRYQRIFLVELDHARTRSVNVLIMGAAR